MTQTRASSTTKATTVPAPGIKTGKIVVKRTIPATVDELFDAWLDPESLAQWMRPGANPHTTVRVDARVGAFEVVMHHQTAVAPLRRIPPRAQRSWCSPGSDATHHAETLVTVEFSAASASTEIVLTHERMPDHEAGIKHNRGWTHALELLEDLLKH
jgi:uncharacterized protein YndB with AHSA1/START domain